MANQTKFGETIISVGDQVNIHQKIIESGKERLSVFKGMIISIRGQAENKSITVRRIAAGGVGVERIWPLNSPWIVKIEVIKKGKVRRAKLYYLRGSKGKKTVKVKSGGEKKPDEKKKLGKSGRKPRRQETQK